MSEKSCCWLWKRQNHQCTCQKIVWWCCVVAAGELESERGVGIEQTAQLPPIPGNVSSNYLRWLSQDRQLICMSSKIHGGLFAGIVLDGWVWSRGCSHLARAEKAKLLQRTTSTMYWRRLYWKLSMIFWLWSWGNLPCIVGLPKTVPVTEIDCMYQLMKKGSS